MTSPWVCGVSLDPGALGPHGSRRQAGVLHPVVVMEAGLAGPGLWSPRASRRLEAGMSWAGPPQGPPIHGEPAPPWGGCCGQHGCTREEGMNAQPSHSPSTPATPPSIHNGHLSQEGGQRDRHSWSSLMGQAGFAHAPVKASPGCPLLPQEDQRGPLPCLGSHSVSALPGIHPRSAQV